MHISQCRQPRHPLWHPAGQEQDPPALLDRPETGVGLLFMCYQSDISNQFAFIQKRWGANDRDFQVPGAGFDPINGSGGTGALTPQKWSRGWDRAPALPSLFER